MGNQGAINMADSAGGFGGGFGGDRGKGGKGGKGKGDKGKGKGKGKGRKGGDKEEWVPCTKLGRLVKSGKIAKLDDIYFYSLAIKEVGTAIRGAILKAKLSVVPVLRGYWGNKIGREHTVPCKVTGKCGSVRMRLIPAPRGT